MGKRLALFLALVMMLVGCGGGYAPSRTADSGGYYGSPNGGSTKTATAQSYSESGADYSTSPNAPPVSASREAPASLGGGGGGRLMRDPARPQPRPHRRPRLGNRVG